MEIREEAILVPVVVALTDAKQYLHCPGSLQCFHPEAFLPFNDQLSQGPFGLVVVCGDTSHGQTQEQAILVFQDTGLQIMEFFRVKCVGLT